MDTKKRVVPEKKAVGKKQETMGNMRPYFEHFLKMIQGTSEPSI